MTTINRAPWTALVDDSGNNLDGTPWNKAAIKDVLLDPIDAAIGPVQTGVWTTFGVSWIGTDGVGPTLGNGTLTLRYSLVGKTCHVALYLLTGSTTGYGSSTRWLFTLPFPAHGAILPGAFVVALYSGAGVSQPPAMALPWTASQLYVITTAGGIVNPTTPFTWSANAQVFMRGTYEIA
jgi:hypothetical protein